MKKILTVLVLLSVSSAVKSQEQTGELLIQRLKDHVYTLASDSLMGRKAGTIFSEKAARYITKNFKDAGIAPFVNDSIYNQTFANGASGGLHHNIIGYIEGSDPFLKDEYIIFGAHYDHLGYRVNSADSIVVYHGADDNASGVAALIEVAGILKKQEGNLKRSVVFVAFDAEESGLHGSALLARRLQPDKVKLMVSMDMIGWLAQSGNLKMTGFGMFEDGETIIDPVVVPQGLRLELKRFDRNIMGGSDHDPFAEKGVPAIHVTTGIKSPYHKPGDTADKIDYKGLALITEYMAAIGDSLANREYLTSSGKRAGKHKSSKKMEFAITGSIGSTKHNYPDGALTGKPLVAWNAGVFTQYNINTHWALRLEMLYNDRTSRFPIENGELGGSYRKFSTQSISVPLNLLYKIPLANQVYNYFNIGGYYSYNIGGILDGDPLDFATGVRRHEYGISAGFGINMCNYGIALTYYRALSPVMYSGAVMKNSSTYLTVYYRF